MDSCTRKAWPICLSAKAFQEWVKPHKAPIPNRPVGWVYDPKGAGFVANPIEVQIHADLQCPVCLAAWPGLMQMADHYGKQVKLSVVIFPLPYHRAAYKCELFRRVLTLTSLSGYGRTNCRQQQILSWLGLWVLQLDVRTSRRDSCLCQ